LVLTAFAAGAGAESERGGARALARASIAMSTPEPCLARAVRALTSASCRVRRTGAPARASAVDCGRSAMASGSGSSCVGDGPHPLSGSDRTNDWFHSSYFFRLGPSWTRAVPRTYECAQAVGMDPPAGTPRYAKDPHRCARRHACGQRFYKRLRGGAVGRCSSPSPCREAVSTTRGGRRRPGEAGISRVVSRGLFGYVGREHRRVVEGIARRRPRTAEALRRSAACDGQHFGSAVRDSTRPPRTAC
jgi:hypothetical protein